MPKEAVYADSLPYGGDSPARSIAEVRWSKDGEYVQLATRCVHASDGETTFKDEGLPTLVAADGWFIDLNRASINKLIRDLRRARDQAFGRDE